MSAQNSHNSSPKNEYQSLGQPHDHAANYRGDHDQDLNGQSDNTPCLNNIHDQPRQIPLGQHNHLTQPVEQLINQQIPSEDLQPNNLYIGNPLVDSQFQNPPPNPLANPPLNHGLYSSQSKQITFAGVHTVAPVVLQSRTILSPAKLASSQVFVQRGPLVSSGALAQSKKLETKVKYEPFEKTVIQYEEVEKTIIEYQPVEKKIKVKIPVEKKVTDYRKCEYLVPANQDKDEEESQAEYKQPAYPAYQRVLTSSTRVLTSPVAPIQSRLLTSTINFKPVTNLGQSTVLLQSQVVRSPVILQQQPLQFGQSRLQAVSSVVSPKATAAAAPITSSKAVTPKVGSSVVSPRGFQQFFTSQTKSQTVKQVSAPLSQSVAYTSSLVRTQPIVTRYAPPVNVLSHTTLSASTKQKPAWGYFNDRVINNSKIIKQTPTPYSRFY